MARMVLKGYVHTPEETQAKRVQFVEQVLAALRKRKLLKSNGSATLFFAQYWDDNADDEVHFEVAISETPTFEGSLYGENVMSEYDFLPLDAKGHRDYGGEPDVKWNGNYADIPVWAAYANGVGSQNNERDENFTKAVIIHGDGTYEFLPMQRPWLDGIMTEYDSYGFSED